MTTTAVALDAPVAAPVKATFSAYGDTFTIDRKPPVLLIAELARTESGEPEAVAVLAEFFEVCLGRQEYRRFKRAAYASDDEGALMLALAAVMEAATSVPTE